MQSQQRYYKFSRYLKERFGCRVYKVSIDAGFSCPNKDGRFSKDGCIYCDNRAFSRNVRIPSLPIEAQIEESINFGKRRYGAEKFIIYFQAYTNTYAPLNILKKRYDTIKNFKDVVGIAIGTRPDCINEEILGLIENYSKDYEVWLEYGLQSIHSKTLEFINRNHDYEDFLRAVESAKKRNIKICAHVIIGLPGERRSEIMETARELGHLRLDGIKIHPLHIIKDTKLEKLFKAGLYKPLELDEFIELVMEFLRYLWPNTVIQRIGADCPPDFLIGPLWILKKNLILEEVEKRLGEEDIFQGALYKDKVDRKHSLIL